MQLCEFKLLIVISVTDAEGHNTPILTAVRDLCTYARGWKVFTSVMLLTYQSVSRLVRKFSLPIHIMMFYVLNNLCSPI